MNGWHCLPHTSVALSGSLRHFTGHLGMKLGQFGAVALEHRGLTVQLMFFELVDLLVPNTIEVLELQHGPRTGLGKKSQLLP